MKVLAVIAGALALAATGLASSAAQAQNLRGAGIFALDPVNEGNALLNVSGQGVIAVSPDVAVFTAGVETIAETATGALRENARQTQAIIDVLRTRGIESRDIQTSRIAVRPITNEERDRYGTPRTLRSGTAAEVVADAMAAMEAMESPQPEERPRIVGYRATNMVTIRQRDLDEVGALIDALAAVGATNIEGPRFMLDDSEETIDRARDLAIADAREEAEAYAIAADMRVVRIVMIDEGRVGGLSSRGGGNSYGFAEAMSYESYPGPTPSEAGELQVTNTVSILFELAPL